jgi:hypothetical protein
MTVETKNVFLRNTLYLFIWLIMILATIILVVAGPVVEGKFYPPVAAFHITERYSDNGDYYIAGYMDKTRGTCEPKELTIRVGSVTEDSYDKIVDADFTPDPADHSDDYVDAVLTTRPSGVQEFGPWRLIPREPPVGPLASITALHRCHPFWNVETVIWSGITEDLFPGLYNDKGDFNDFPFGNEKQSRNGGCEYPPSPRGGSCHRTD